MKINPVYLIMFSILFSIYSCEDIVENVDLPDVQPKLVLFSYINPGADTVYAQVTRSRTINEKITDYDLTVNNANVTLSQMGGVTVQLQFNPEQRYYYSPVPQNFLETGRHYTINAGTPDGKHVDASCSLPVQNTSLRITGVDSSMIQDRMRYRFRLEFKDIQGVPDFYRIIPKAIVKFEWDGNIQFYEYNAGFIYGNEFVSTRNNDGGEFVAEVYFDVWRYNYNAEQLIGMKFYLLSIDEHYYNFHTSLQRYVPDNPFSEPIIVYSNVNNGLGVFAGFNPYLVEYWFENLPHSK